MFHFLFVLNVLIYFYLRFVCCLVLFYVSFISCSLIAAPPLPNKPTLTSSQKDGGEQEEQEEQEVEVICLRPSGFAPELYTPLQLFQHRPLEAPVSPQHA